MFPFYYWMHFCIPNAGRPQRPTGVLQAVAPEEAGAAAERATAGGAAETGAGQRLPLTQPRGVWTRLQAVSSLLALIHVKACSNRECKREVPSCCFLDFVFFFNECFLLCAVFNLFSGHGIFILFPSSGGWSENGRRSERSSRRLWSDPAGWCWRSGARDARGTCCAQSTKPSHSDSLNSWRTASETKLDSLNVTSHDPQQKIPFYLDATSLFITKDWHVRNS